MNENNKEFLKYIKENRILMDGAMGTYFRGCYLEAKYPAEMYNLSDPDKIIQIHKSYLEAGARLLRTNSFAMNAQTIDGSKGLFSMEYPYKSDDVLKQIYDFAFASYENGKKAVEEFCIEHGCQEKVWIAGDIGPVPQIGGVSDEDIYAQYKTIAKALLDAGAELILFETFSDFTYIRPVVEYIRSFADPVIMVSFCLNKFGYTKAGLSAEAILKYVKQNDWIDCVGFNCGVGSAHMLQILKKLDFGDLCVSVVPNSGYTDLILDRQVYEDSVLYFSQNMKEILNLGVNMIGGCCGTSPAYIKQLKKILEVNEKRNAYAMRKHQLEDEEQLDLDKSHNVFLNKLMAGEKVVAVELDPPFDGHPDKIIQAASLLKNEPVDLITFSDSPMGKMRTDSMMTSMYIKNQTELNVMPHISCRDKNVIAMGASFMGAHLNGIRNCLIVTGDPVPAGDRQVTSSVFDFNSIKLMNYLKQLNMAHFRNDPIIYGAALNYGRTNIDKEIERMYKKCEAGADYFLTQPIYSDEDIKRIEYIKSKVDTKILCGIMPLVSYRNAMFMKHEIYGVRVPDEVVNRYSPDMTREEGENTGISIALEIVKKLENIADGYYFMIPFNRVEMIQKILKQMCLD